MSEPQRFTRRSAIQAISWLPTVGLTSSLIGNETKLLGQSKSGLAPLNRFPRVVHEHFVERVEAIRESRLKTLYAINSKAAAQDYVADVQKKIRESFGDFPEKTPLRPRVTGAIERADYRIEKVIFESRPHFLVTANLYIPKRRRPPFPGVVGTCGHSRNGKAEPAYQSFAQGLARQGYMVLLYDPIGQGERLQYVDEQLKSTVGVGVREHLLGGNQQFLVDEFFGSWRAWDGIRALDYLLERDEIDKRHLGVTGNSGGGTMTTWLCGVESRWTMAAPSCFVTSFRNNLQNELPADTEQCPPQALALGLDHFDFLAAMAPKPVIILAKEKDYFDARGAEKAHQHLRHLYRQLGAEQNVRLFIGPTYHGYSKENREAMYSWFNQTTGISNARREPEITLEKDASLQCTARGQVATLGSKPIYFFTGQLSRTFAEERKQSKRPIGERLAKLLKIQSKRRPGAVPYRVVRESRKRRYPLPYFVTYVLKPEKGIQLPVYRLYAERHYSRPPVTDSQPATLYVSHHSCDSELRDQNWLRDIVTNDRKTPFYGMDVRGIGETRPNTCGENSFLQPYGNDYFYAIHALMLDDSYVAQKTRDVLRTLDWLKQLGHGSIHLVAHAWGTIPATFAALLHDTVSKVTLKAPLESYASIAEARDYDWPLSSFVPGVLKELDLPDCYAALGKRLKRIPE